jgi:hypothetical protein
MDETALRILRLADRLAGGVSPACGAPAVGRDAAMAKKAGGWR